MTEKQRTKTAKPGEQVKVTPKTVKPVKDSASVPMQDLLGEKLRAYYDQVAREPVPDRFEQLLKELEARSIEKKLG
jgi:DNA-binding protein Fis